MTDRPAPQARVDEIDRGAHRIDGISDAFFASVITLLVIDLRLPEDSSQPITQQSGRCLPPAFLYLNGILLLGVAVMPFSTALLADTFASAEARTGAVAYTGVLA